MIAFDPLRQIVYEDNHLIIINKFPSQIVQGDRTGDEPLSEQVRKFLKLRDAKPGNVFLGVVHRLDRPVSGLVLFAKTSKALGRLNRMISQREIIKIYWAAVNNPPPKPEDHIIHYLYKVEKKNKSYASDRESGNSRRAELRYRLVGQINHYYLLEVELFTGRHHQIRVQLAKIGCLIKGDVKYGFPRPNPDGSIHLHARSVSLIHPVSLERIMVVADPPEDPVWKRFIP